MGMSLIMSVLLLSLVACELVTGEREANFTLPACQTSFANIQPNLLSQDTLYNTVLSTCQANSLKSWQYSSYTTHPSPDFHAHFKLPKEARLQCAKVKVSCLLPVNGSLSIIFAAMPMEGDVVMCTRGMHIYSIWNSSSVGNLHAYSDTLVSPVSGTATVSSTVDLNVEWPLSLFLAPLRHDAQSYILSANRNYLRSVCKI
jgi:hypothetical protein